MMRILFLRHGSTIWNEEKKIQGHTDITLSKIGVHQVSSWYVPEDIEQWYVSPLLRAQQTAQTLGVTQYVISNLLIEMNWGSWEGQTLREIRASDIAAYCKNESKGLDFKPDGGESPREVRERLSLWLKSLPIQKYIGAVVHKGVINSALSLATDWDMKSNHPIKIRDNKGYQFVWDGKKLLFDSESNLLNEL